MTLAEKAYDALRHDIIRGELPPGRPLRLSDLSERYDMGFSPLREALNRLHAERLVTAESLRGFRVAPLSIDELHDAVNVRIKIESDALRASIRLGDDDWAAGIVSALYALNLQVGRTGPDADIWTLEARHYAFHRALLTACNSPWTLEFFERLYAATERYRIPVLLASTHSAGRDVQAEHGALAEATLARDADKATALLEAHYRKTASHLTTVFGTKRPDEVTAAAG
ncbi:FCD domain-containing protein [Rhizobium lusitanum]|uniref:FCD domain-containing protein n=1 Tax=Rhizobium lusitanum TaxID=293958 RepID=A0A6L9UBU9_9HYPH|nr:FCD domain-containing protein [Rhizobium lusitanum]NEI71756.1 FCD domain-containing protein [Rhizobium lusitanum]